eukprot:107369-Pelagomonas_calceolata.AAC.2
MASSSKRSPGLFSPSTRCVLQLGFWCKLALVRIYSTVTLALVRVYSIVMSLSVAGSQHVQSKAHALVLKAVAAAVPQICSSTSDLPTLSEADPTCRKELPGISSQEEKNTWWSKSRFHTWDRQYQDEILMQLGLQGCLGQGASFSLIGVERVLFAV